MPLAAEHSRVPCFLQENRARGVERQGILQRHQPTLEGVEPADAFKSGKVDRMLQDLENAFRHLAQAFISSLLAKAFMQRARAGSTVVG